MKKFFLIILTCFCVCSCGVTSLYYWGGNKNGASAYEALTYQSYDKQTPESRCKLICMYEDMVSNPGGKRMIPPPGICAEFGYLLLQPETAQIFAEYATYSQKNKFEYSDYSISFPEKGKKMLEKEIELYPESIKFIKPLIDKFCKQENL